MLTSTLRYPKTDRYIRVHESLISACDKNICAAALIAFFEGWHNYKKQQAEYTAIYNTMAQDAGTGTIIDVSGWQYHTMEQLEKGVLIYKDDQIRAALKLLEAKGFIETDVPERLRILHKTGRTRWFLLRADIINEFFDSYELGLRPKKPKALQFPPPKPADVDSKALSARAQTALEVLKYRARRRAEFWRARGKKVTEGRNGQKQIALMMDRLAEGFRPEELCHAFEGCLSSDHHIGLNDRKTVYDSVELVYKDTASVNRFIGYADSAGITLKSTRLNFEGKPVGVPGSMQPAALKPLTELIAGAITQDEPDYQRLEREFNALRGSGLVNWTHLHAQVKEKLEGEFGMFGVKFATRFGKFMSQITGNNGK